MNHFVSDGEKKYYLNFVDDQAPCNVMTIGVGMDYSGETTFSKRYPQCHMTAVDPVSDFNEALVKKVPNARFFEATISGRNETHVAVIKESNSKYFKTNNKHLILEDRIYRQKIVQHYGITSLLEKINGKKTIDLMMVDIEGSEFRVLPVLIG